MPIDIVGPRGAPARSEVEPLRSEGVECNLRAARHRARAAGRRRTSRGIAASLCLPAGTPTLDTRDRSAGFVHTDQRRARAVLGGTDDADPWVRGRLLRVAEAYAQRLRDERDATTPRCAPAPTGSLAFAFGVACGRGATPWPRGPRRR